MNRRSISLVEKHFDKEKVGEILKRKREAAGMTQEQVAEKINTTRQNVAKIEKTGTNNMEMIESYCEVYHCELYEFFQDSYDVEGTVGEIGKEILFVLLESEGYITVEKLIEKYMYGMSKERVNKEIMKLFAIGMCIREQFTDFYEIKNDGLFLTAKGLITLKNSLQDRGKSENFREMLEEVNTYEMIIGNHKNYQEVLNERKLEKKIRNIKYCGTYRVDYLQWLHKNFHEKNYGTEPVSHPSKSELPSLPGESAYIDILFRMALGLDNQTLEELFYEYFAQDEEDLEQRFKEIQRKEKSELGKGLCEKLSGDLVESDLVEQEAFLWFDGAFSECKQKTEKSFGEELLGEDYRIYMRRLDSYFSKSGLQYGNIIPWLQERMEYLGTTSIFPAEWFGYEEIKEFILKNFRKAKTREERLLDSYLKELNKKYPETKEYYRFPKDWDEPYTDLVDVFYETSGIDLRSRFECVI